jgi:DNA-directed RNA polymerase specialized sigma24 family protein
MARKPSQGDKASAPTIVYLYGEGLSAREIAVRLGCGKSTVLLRLHEAGISLRSASDYGYKRLGKRNAPRRRDIFDGNIIGLYKSGLSTTAIAQQLGCHKSTVWRRLKNAGTEFRPAWFDRQKFPTLQIVCLYCEGLTAREVAAKLGCTRRTVTRRLHQAGISRRSLRGWQNRGCSTMDGSRG